MCNKTPYDPANIVICFPQNHNRKIIKNLLPSYYYLPCLNPTIVISFSSAPPSEHFIVEENPDQVEQFILRLFLILPAVFPVVLPCNIPTDVLHHEPVRKFIVQDTAAVIHPVALRLHQPLQIRCRPGIIRLHPLPLPCILLLPGIPSPEGLCCKKRFHWLHRISLIWVSSIFICSVLIHACFTSFLLFSIPYAF